MLREQILKADRDTFTSSHAHKVMSDMVDFKLKLTLLPKGTFASYSAQKQAEGADIAHLKPPHVNPPRKYLSFFAAPAPCTSQPSPTLVSQENRVPVA